MRVVVLSSCPPQTSIQALSRGIRAKGSLSDDDGNENGKKEQGKIFGKTTTLHVLHALCTLLCTTTT